MFDVREDGMTNQIILVADEDTKNLQILKENLEAAGFLVIAAPNGNKAWEEIQRNLPKLILSEVNLSGLNGYQLLERLHADPNTASLPLIFLTNQREIQQRVRAFELGAKDYLIKPLHVKEVIAHIRMVLRRLERRKAEQFETYLKFSGRLDQLNLADLIESFGVERKTGVLTLSNGRKTGHVYFRDGAVVNASLGDFKQEGAVYQMFPWRTGYFNMVFREIDVADEISTSNLGLLLQGIKRTELREKLITQLSSPKTAFTVTPTFKLLIEKKKVGGDASNFINLLDGQRDIEQIIDDSGLDDLTALARIVRLYQQGFIKPTIPAEKKPVLPGDVRSAAAKEAAMPPIPRSKPKDISPSLPATRIPDEALFDELSLEPEEQPKQDTKPIVERIESERKKLIVPEEEEIIHAEPDEEAKRVLFDDEIIEPVQATFTPTSAEADELSLYSDQLFSDEEFIHQHLDENGTGEAEPADFEASEEIIIPEPIEPSQQVTEISVKDLPEPGKPVPPQTIKTAPRASEPPSRDQSVMKNNILIISVDDDCKDELMDILTDDNFQSKVINELGGLQINLGRISFEEFSQYQAISVSVDKPFVPFLNSIKQRIAGLIVTFDCSRANTWEYTNYLIHSLWEKLQLPYAVAVMNMNDDNSMSLDVIRYQMKIAEDIPIIEWDPVDKTSVRELLKIVARVSQKQKPRKTQGMLDSMIEKVMA